MILRQFVEPGLAQYAYLVGCAATGEALVIDPHIAIDEYQRAAAAEGLRIAAVAETHVHADFVSGAPALARDPPYREVFVLRDIEELSGEAVAQRLGITVAAQKSRLHRARLQLREHLDAMLAAP